MEKGDVRSGKRGRTFSYDSIGSNLSSWGSTSASASDGSGNAKRHLSDEGMLSFRNRDRQIEGQSGSDEDNSVSEGNEENWDSDNATADENSEMFCDGNDMPDWTSDEEGAVGTNLDTGNSRSSSAITCRSPSVGVVSPFSPILSSSTSAKDSRRRRRNAKRMNEIVDDLGQKVRKMNHNEYTEGMEYVQIINNTPFRGTATNTGEQSMNCGYISEASSSSRVSSSSRSSSQVGFEGFGHPPSTAIAPQSCSKQPLIESKAPMSDGHGMNGRSEGDMNRGIGIRSARFAHDITHSECIVHDDLT